MMSSGLNEPTPAMLMPAFAVPYAAPMAKVSLLLVTSVHENIIYRLARNGRKELPLQQLHQSRGTELSIRVYSYEAFTINRTLLRQGHVVVVC